MNDTTTPTTFAEAEVRLAQSLPGYEARPQQQALARAVESALDSRGHLMAEAGCGTGKSLGYLIPSILSGDRVVVSTATKALQDQIANKDLPFLAEHLGVDFTHTILKGRSNYVCLAKMADADTPSTEEVRVFIKDHSDFSGERDDLPMEITDREWRGITVSADECPGKKECFFGEICYAEKAKARAQESDVVVVNHALLCTDLMVREATGGNASMIGAYETLVVDEAHELEDWVTSTFGVRLTRMSFTDLTSKVRVLVREFVSDDDPAAQMVEDSILDLAAALDTLWAELARERPRGEKVWRLRWSSMVRDGAPSPLALAFMASNDALVSLSDAVESINRQRILSDHGRDRLALLVTRTGNLSRRFTKVFVEMLNTKPAEVSWCEIEEEGSIRERIVVQSAPIEVDGILSSLLWPSCTAILVSATLSIKGSFDYLAGRLGLANFSSLDVGTPFDYKTQSALYVPQGFVSPKATEWKAESIHEIRRLVQASNGRALLLFTSVSQMRMAYDALNGFLPYQCLIQGERSNKVLAEEFMADKHSVLFATKSFFTGVDFQGEACSLVVIDKLPFPVPTEPVFEARCEAIEARGGNVFTDYTIPVMSLILKQGYGRLIRHRDDRGVVAILDSRLNSGWGKKIRRGLPEGQDFGAMFEVENFFEAVA